MLMRRAFTIWTLLALACGGGDFQAPGDGGGGGSATWHLTGGATELAVDDAGGTNETSWVQLVMSAQGRPLMAALQWGGYPTMKRWDGPISWTDLGGPASPAKSFGTVAGATLPGGEPVIAWADSGTGEILAAHYDSGLWTPLSVRVADPIMQVTCLRGASGSAGPVLLWIDEYPVTGGQGIYVARWDGASWVELGTPRALAAGWPSVTTRPDGDPVIGYDGGGATKVERWDSATSAWVTLPAVPSRADRVAHVSVAVDGAGAVYVATTYLLPGYETYAVYGLAPGANSWTSLGLPVTTNMYSYLALAGFPGGGVAAGWTLSIPFLYRWRAGAWEEITTSVLSQWFNELRPMIGVASDDDVWYGFTDGAGFDFGEYKRF